MKRSAVLIYSKKKASAAQSAREELIAWLREHGYQVVDVTASKDPLPASKLKNVVLGVVIGGDGTFLRLVRRLEKKDQFPLMGVNLGSLGFITEIPREEMIEAVNRALGGRCTTEARRLLEVELWRRGKLEESGIVFNDAVVTKDARTTMLKFDVQVGGELLSYVRADGYIVSTPTGSTAYNLSAGGPLLHPHVGAFVLVPICSHSLSSRPVVVPHELEVEILPREFKGAVYLVYDGQVNFEIQAGDRILIRTSRSALRLLRVSRRTWSEALRAKLEMA